MKHISSRLRSTTWRSNAFRICQVGTLKTTCARFPNKTQNSRRRKLAEIFIHCRGKGSSFTSLTSWRLSWKDWGHANKAQVSMDVKLWYFLTCCMLLMLFLNYLFVLVAVGLWLVGEFFCKQTHLCFQKLWPPPLPSPPPPLPQPQPQQQSENLSQFNKLRNVQTPPHDGWGPPQCSTTLTCSPWRKETD